MLDSPDSVLFPASADRAALAAILAAELNVVRETMRQGRVAPEFDQKRLAAELARFSFAAPMSLHEVLPWVVRQLREGGVQVTHPRYFGLFNPAPGFPSELAEQIVAALNPQLAALATSPAAIAIEAHVIDQVARRAGLPAGSTGHFTNSGSEANFTAMICALTKANPAYRENGARAFRTPPAIYISREAHLAWLKIAHQAGIGRLAVRMIETDGQGRMNVAVLGAAVRADVKNGAVPVMIVATAGTTVAGMVDPLQECAEIARAVGAWFHVDAAWGGAAIACNQLRAALAGLEQADSVTIDAHKWFATTMSCGMFITKAPWLLTESFGVKAGFMPHGSGQLEPYTSSVMWSRRFLGLRMFLNLAAIGWAGYARHVDRTVRLISILRERLTAEGWTVVNPQALGVLCVVPPGICQPVHTIVEEIVASGQAWICAALFEGREVIRICITNGLTERRDVETLATLLLGFARVSDQQHCPRSRHDSSA